MNEKINAAWWITGFAFVLVALMSFQNFFDEASVTPVEVPEQVVLNFPAAEMCDASSDYSSRFICKAPPEVPLNPRQELSGQIRLANQITNREMPERRVAQVTDYLLDECPEYALDIYLIGVPESYNWNRNRYRGDYRVQYELGEPCENCTCVSDACYSEDSCDPNEEENCVATSCGPFHIRHIYRDFDCDDVRNERFSIEWMCNWMGDHYPNIAAHNAGLRGASTHSAADDYGYRHFLLKELITSNHGHNLDDWGWGLNASSGNRIVYLPSIQ